VSLDPASERLLRTLFEDGAPAALPFTPSCLRLVDVICSGYSGPGLEVGSVENLRLPTQGGSFRIRVLKPHRNPLAIVVFFHGGGWVVGDIDLQYDHVARDLVSRAGVTVVLVNYRKAPEHPFPAAVDDCWAALTWADEHRSNLATRAAPLIVAGDSAGGNLAAVMTQLARDEGGLRIDGQMLIYPVTDWDVDTPSFHAPENQLMLDRTSMIWFWDQYVPDPAGRADPRASPRRAESLGGLPPALVYLAEHDPLYDDGMNYATALAHAGNHVVLKVAKEQMHGFFQMANLLPGYDEGLEIVGSFIESLVGSDQDGGVARP
jgi:acetyl esterase